MAAAPEDPSLTGEADEPRRAVQRDVLPTWFSILVALALLIPPLLWYESRRTGTERIEAESAAD